jgi:hypothetical protein
MPTDAELAVAIDWPTFIGRHDLTWDRLPEAWDEGPFLGNGMLGAYLCKEPGHDMLRLGIGRMDVHDHRSGGAFFDRARLPIGHFFLVTEGAIVGCRWRLDLWNARLTGELLTDRGHLDIRVIVHSIEMAIICEVESDAGERGCHWEWEAEIARSPRQTYGIIHQEAFRTCPGYVDNPAPSLRDEGRTQVCEQSLLSGGQTATAWMEEELGSSRILYTTVFHSYPDADASAGAVAEISRIASIGKEELYRTHREWWNRYYPSSFLSLPDAMLESFYWIQMYKFACATRADRALMDNAGPWLDTTPWPTATWNLNVQLSYSALYAANRLELAESLWRKLEACQGTLAENIEEPWRGDSSGIGLNSAQDLSSPVSVPGKHTSGFVELGNLTWALYDCWLHYRMTMDRDLLARVIFPLLKRSINYYLHFLKPDEDGVLHVMPTSSPEYGVVVEDCNYDVSLLRWGCGALLASCRLLAIDDPLIPRWREVLERLASYPEHPTEGFMIGRNTRYAKSHRHFSHLMMIFPLHLVNIDREGDRERIERSLSHWQSKKEALAGYSYTGAASIAASLGEGDEALAYLRGFTSGYLRPNTLYKENGPVIETPLAAAQSIHDMLLQSWGECIRVFPAVPSDWRDVAFHDLRAEGAFLVSAVRKDGRVRFIRIKSLAGEPCRLKCDLTDPVSEHKGSAHGFKRIGEGIYEIELSRDEELILHDRAWRGPFTVAPCPGNGIHYFGSMAMGHESVDMRF